MSIVHYMEIISYIGAAGSYGAGQVSGRIRKPAVRLRLHLNIPRLYIHKPAALMRKNHAHSWVFFLLLVSIVVPGVVYKVAAYFENHIGPLSFQDAKISELAVLDQSMAQFALDHDSDGVDENGNVLADDGTILTPASVGIGKQVSYSEYKVKTGDTISSIARHFSLTNISTVIAVNDIDNVRTLRAGQNIRIPSCDGITHIVASRESLSSLSVKYHISVEELLDANDLASHTLVVGQELFIPGAKLDGNALRKAMGELFLYPLSSGWRLTSCFGPRADPFTGVQTFHTGIDLAIASGTPIKAAMSGKIVYVGFSNIFGNYVIINHDNGYQTLYGHMLKTAVRVGQAVSQGTQIGLVGSTGYSTGPHLHFTVFKNGKLVDPLTVLK
jgi:murein DD-endopeptidase MepM/ murein hydrolase activator NlpD